VYEPSFSSNASLYASIHAPLCLPNSSFLLLSIPPSHSLPSHMLNRSKDQFYAYKKSPEWDLPRSEEREAVEKTQQAVRDNEHEVRSMFRDDRPVDWVIM